MSLVYITHHNENIAAIEKHMNFTKLTATQFGSKFRKKMITQDKKLHIIPMDKGKVMITTSSKCKNRSMGYAQTPLRLPCQFLRKHEGLQWRRERLHECTKGSHGEPLPRFERDKTPPKPKKVPNFIAENIIKLKSAPATQWAPRYVDTVRGDTHNLLGTGLVPQYVCHRNFGKVPCYLRYHKKHFTKLGEHCEEHVEQKLQICAPLLAKTGIRQMTDEERKTIMTGLKKNLAELYNAYQRYSLYTDSLQKQLRKGHLEEKMRLLEQDMNLIDNNPIIYISSY